MDSILKRLAAAKLAMHALWLIIDSVDGLSNEAKADLHYEISATLLKCMVIDGEAKFAVQARDHTIAMKVRVEE